MRRWLQPRPRLWRCAGLARLKRLPSFSTVASGPRGVERISVPVGSSGDIQIDLHNIAKVSSADPLLLYLPPFSNHEITETAHLPQFCQHHATAVIHYRWGASEAEDDEGYVSGPAGQEGEPKVEKTEDFTFHPIWPTPIHDVLEAYTWITENLGAPDTNSLSRRDLYVCGSYLGASLATGLALTESYAHEPISVRGCIAYNGIYDWTTALPDHPIHKPPKDPFRAKNSLENIAMPPPGDVMLLHLLRKVRTLFGKPDHLFDPLASACFFFQTPGLYSPYDFDVSALAPPMMEDTSDLDKLIEYLIRYMGREKPPQKSSLSFPPGGSTLKIPKMLLLHDTPPLPPPSLQQQPLTREKDMGGNSFRTQAEALAGAYMSSGNPRETHKDTERVLTCDVGPDDGKPELGLKAAEIAGRWLMDQIEQQLRAQ
ncbi:hypothetical protein F4780DRAFT_140728 [Xylariomycetidae sp. FL0641]|nr:hypothetical protein F4780DRAFT_140728 [Xylariomycetidae sp. FL0641]